LAYEQRVVAVVAAEAGEAERDEREGVRRVGVELVVQRLGVAQQRVAAGLVEGEPVRRGVGEGFAVIGGGRACDNFFSVRRAGGSERFAG